MSRNVDYLCRSGERPCYFGMPQQATRFVESKTLKVPGRGVRQRDDDGFETKRFHRFDVSLSTRHSVGIDLCQLRVAVRRGL